MASPSFKPHLAQHRRISLAEIDAAVAARLGATRGLGNSQPACFNRQVAMYLAKHVAGWTTTVIGRFYNGRDHSTVCYGIQRIEALRESDSDVDALLTQLKQKISGDTDDAKIDDSNDVNAVDCSGIRKDELADLVAERVCAYLEKRLRNLF
jgi:hypothetical protein